MIPNDHSTRRETIGLGMAWLFLATMGTFFSLLLSYLEIRVATVAAFITVFSSTAGLVIGAFTLVHERWAVHAGLAMTYFWTPVTAGVMAYFWRLDFVGAALLFLLALVLQIGAILSAHSVLSTGRPGSDAPQVNAEITSPPPS